MSEWQPIETAPKDGRVFMSWYGEVPEFVAWVDTPDETGVSYSGVWPFRKKHAWKIKNRGWRVLTFIHRENQWGVDGSIAPFSPTHWMPVPEPPK